MHMAQGSSDVLNPQRKAGLSHDDESDAHDITGKMRAMLDKGKEKAADIQEGFEGYVKEKPIQTVLIAAGAGLLVGYLFGRRR
jgi:ElaB/YqjD/DUF883 family membrane-anchored ribosome-binding protein